MGSYTAPTPMYEPVKVTIRGVDHLVNMEGLPDAKRGALTTLLCLVALDNPTVDQVLSQLGVVLELNGKVVFPTGEMCENA